MAKLMVVVAVSAVGVVESTTENTTECEPMADNDGVPVIAPVTVLSTSPFGRPAALYVYGVLPPVATPALLHALPAVPLGREVVEKTKVDMPAPLT